MGIREPNRFQIQLADTVPFITCVKCTNNINQFEDPEYVRLWAASGESWALHLVCFADVTAGMVEFFKEFIVKKSKKRIVQ